MVAIDSLLNAAVILPNRHDWWPGLGTALVLISADCDLAGVTVRVGVCIRSAERGFLPTSTPERLPPVIPQV
ncbi:MAG: hypothetical protein ABSD67_14625 [Terracidiphilus sp.]|jgi:hypothetical protein